MRTRPLHIVWVEDSVDDIDLFSLAVKRAQVTFTLDILNDGEEALRHLTSLDREISRRPDLILLDLNIPKKDGRQVLKDIKQTAHLKNIPVVVFTTSCADSDITGSYSSGASCYLVKPDNFDKLVALIKKLCAFWEDVEFSTQA